MSLNELEDVKQKHAKSSGALYHITNPVDAWLCNECFVFGRGGNECWSCESKNLSWQYIPRFSGGTASASYEENPPQEEQNE